MTKPSFLEKMEQAWQEAVIAGINVNKAVCFAQAALESNWGSSALCQKANNLFGIKATQSWKGETVCLTGYEEVKGKNQYSKMLWRKYPSWAACIINYSIIINANEFYRDALIYIDNAEGFIRNIVAEGPSKAWPGGEPGWATDSRYVEKVKSVGLMIERYGGPKWS